MLFNTVCQSYVLDLIEAHTQACGAPAEHSVLAVYSTSTWTRYCGANIYKLYVNMYLYLSINLHSTE